MTTVTPFTTKSLILAWTLIIHQLPLFSPGDAYVRMPYLVVCATAWLPACRWFPGSTTSFGTILMGPFPRANQFWSTLVGR
ncbi:uncharacterized protein F4807DRAFT_231837 [Annulohypoxylon truncatum]|uniref:uncharacterized protein n=1 Tax=Annulohypoxylon truncatum TaxID=327061 RepID=UPI0020077F54|nr:uncharacterized protein F4807DRAFT_231837 [Annulohypoxylon truncatum]KAI1206442.1 hypothetical protein F4807DRAFT_231837 [Annulohypoxylon truncatum]